MIAPSTTSERKRRPLLHTMCAIVLVFSLTISPIAVSAEGDPTSTPVEVTTPAPSETTPPPSTDTSTQVVPPTTEIVPPVGTTPPPVAESTTAPTAEQTPAVSQGPQSPTGAENKSYTFNSTTGLWENDKYTWDPATNQTKPKVAPSYSYNPTTGQWDTTEWRYDAPSGKYVQNVISTPTLPVGASIASDELAGDNQQTTKSLSSALPSSDKTNDINSSSKSSGLFDLFYNASISNIFKSQATSGDALVTGNTLAGSAVTGAATAIATVLNLLQSSWDYVARGGLTTFVSNMFGDVFGDLLVDPGTLSKATSTIPQDQLKVNATGSGNITNDLTLSATSGDASVTKNTTAGDATSGDANAIANIINSLGSTVSAGNTFLGILNIFGNLNGDILVPSQLLNLLGLSATTAAQPASLDATTNQTINTNVTSDAVTGGATVADNTSAGTATTGDASTSVNVLNLTGRQVIGKNALLVFVNVLGKWLGLIVDAPAGTKTAALGDPSSSSGVTAPSTITTKDTQTITNNLALAARSGDSTVSKNTSAGDATSGDASTTANVVNMENSNLALSDWFGILFINVFGSWYGSFGIDTAAGETLAASTTSTQAATSSQQPQTLSQNLKRRATTFSAIANSDTIPEQTGVVLASTTRNKTTAPSVSTDTTNTTPVTNRSINAFSIIGTLFGLSILATERTLSHRKKTVA